MGTKKRVGEMTIFLQEDFLRENEMIQVRMVLDKRNLKFNAYQGEYEFAS